MNLEPITESLEPSQSEVNQKDKDTYCILMHIYGIKKNGTEEYLQGSNGETDIQNRLMDTGRGEEWVRRMERETWKLPSPYVK